MNEIEKQQFRTHWEQVRRKGWLLYITNIAIVWGTLAAVFVRLTMGLLDQGFTTATLSEAFISHEFLQHLGLYLAGGLCLGIVFWFYQQWRYRRIRRP